MLPSGTLVCTTAQTRENAPRGPVGRFTGILNTGKEVDDMEHIDALEAVRRLTLERDALAEQVRRLEAVLYRQAGEAHLKLNASRIVLNESTGKWEPETPQASERRERPKTDAETGEGGNGAPRAPQTCEQCKHAVPGAHAMLCTHHSPHTTGQHGERGHWPVVLMTDRCGDWEGVV